MSASPDDRRNGPSSIRRGGVQAYIVGLLWFAAFEAAYYFAHRYGMSLSRGAAAPFWIPDSILLCALLSTRPRYWTLFVVAPLPVWLFSEFTAGLPLWYLLGVFAVDSAKNLAAAAILRRVVADPVRPQSTRDFVMFAAVVVFGIPFLSAFAGAAVRSTMGYPFWASWEQWFFGDVLAQLVVTPFILYWIIGLPQRNWAPTRRRALEAGLLIAGLLVTGYLAAHTGASSRFFTETRFYAPVPFLFWAALRFGMPGTAGAVAIVAFFVVEAAIGGHGPFAGDAPADVARALQNFLFLRSAPLYIVAVLVEQMRSDQRLLRESEERFRRMAHGAPVLIWMSKTDQLRSFFNQMWLDFTGRSLEQEVGTGWTEAVHPEDLKWCRDRCHSAFDARQAFEMEYRLRRHDGEYRWILDKCVPLATNGDFAGYIGSAIDITDMKRAEETNRALAHTQRLALLGELTGSIAHELRQSLSAISLNAQAVEMMVNSPSPPADEMREMVSDIRRSVVRADSVIGRIRDFLRKREVRMQAVDVNAAMADVLLLTASDAARRGVQIDTAFAPGLPPVLGDRMQLQQVLLNLVVNGMDAENHLDKEARRLTLRTCLLGDRHVEVTVSDSGCGIPEEQLPLLFDAFFSTRADGMGLGLSIARTIITAHRGRIWAENNPNGGATFHFTVPLAWPAASDARPLPLSA